MSEHAHATLSPSSAHRWMRCPGSIRLSAGVPDESSEAAAEGTFAHEIAARCLKSGNHARSLLGVSDIVHTVDDDMAQHLQTYLDYVRAIDCIDRWIETRVTLHGIAPEVWGTSDATILSACRRVLHVADLKFGQGVYVAAENNPQTMIYGLGALLTLPQAMPGIFSQVEEVTMHIVQPRHFKGRDNQPFTIPVDDLQAWGRGELWSAIEAAKAPKAPLCAGDWCRFCPARRFCPELKAQAVSRVQHLFDDESLATPAKQPPRPQDMTKAELAVALKAFPVIERWMDSVREHAYQLATRGDPPEGFKLVTKEGNREWIDPTVAALVLEAHGIQPFAEPKLLSPYQAIQKLPKPYKGLVDGKLARRESKGTTLVPESDERPALPRGAEVFNDGTQTE